MVGVDLFVATEDALSEAVAERLIEEENQGMSIAVRLGRRGNTYLREKLPSFVSIAKTSPLLLLTDLDREICPATLLHGWRGKKIFPSGLLFRVVVREIEAWLLADRKGFSEFSGVPVHRIPEHPESLDDPKATLLNLVRTYGKRAVREALLPGRNSTARIGLMYNQALCGFVRESWSPAKASEGADSLRRTIGRIHELRLAGQSRSSV
ncbi:MAG: hypothetical protein FNP40_03940 [Dehalobacter sp. 4CP]|nr:hypothetical protein [Dehalobacter sp. 4CP]